MGRQEERYDGEERRRSCRASSSGGGDDDGRPWWTKQLIQMGPVAGLLVVFILVGFGWVSSPLLKAIEESNALTAKVVLLVENIEKNSTKTQEVAAEAQKVVGRAQEALANAQKAIADNASAREARLEALQAELKGLMRNQRILCRITASRDSNANRLCDDL